jgi:hypothetical protein
MIRAFFFFLVFLQFHDSASISAILHPQQSSLVRVAFAQSDETMAKAVAQLRSLLQANREQK